MINFVIMYFQNKILEKGWKVACEYSNEISGPLANEVQYHVYKNSKVQIDYYNHAMNSL